MSEFPEHDKLMAVHDQSQALGHFLDVGLLEQGIVLAEWVEDDMGNSRLVSTSKRIQSILATHFEIDEDKLEAEKRQMLDRMREAGL